MTSVLPSLHRNYIDRVVAAAKADSTVEALLAGGSLVHGGFDEHSDLDFVLVVGDDVFQSAMAGRRAFADSIGGLVSAFTGEHVGEPR